MAILNTELMHINMETITFRDKFTPPNEEENDIMTLLYVVMAIGMIGLYVESGKGHEA